MKKMKDIFAENMVKAIGICIGILVVLGGIVALIVFVILPMFNKNNQEELNMELEKLGKDFYENYYVESIPEADRETMLVKFENIGIKVNLENLSRYSTDINLDEIFVNAETDEKCNLEDSKVTIYPKAPYGKTDYTIENTLVCGFEEE